MADDWMKNARCAGDEEFTELPPEVASRVCSDCPVRWECLQWGMQDPAVTQPGQLNQPHLGAQDHIVYGGVPIHQLRRMTRAVRPL